MCIRDSIGIVYVYQEEYRTALQYYRRADSVITKYDVKDFKQNIPFNIGDAYDRLSINDSAFLYYNKALEISKISNDPELLGLSMTGLGHTQTKLGNYTEALL